MDYLKIFLTSVASFVVLLVMTKLMGEKQISQMSMLDYVTGITIGSIAAEFATELESPFKPLLSVVVFGLVSVVCSIVTSKSTSLRKIISGRPLTLMDNGMLFRDNFKKARIDINDFMTLARVNGYFDISQIQTAIMECNGSISFLPMSSKRPLQTNDMNIIPQQESIGTNVILDGHVMKENLKRSGKNNIWLDEQLRAQGYKSSKEVYLAVLQSDNSILVYPTVNKKADKNRFN